MKEIRKEILQNNNVLKQNLLLQVRRKTTQRLSKNRATNQSGITLIALVVTIVVLLILAGITIALVFGQNGVIKKAQDSKEQTEIGEMRDKLEMAKVPVYADGKGSYKVEDYWDRIESEGLIADKDADKIDNGDGTYEITTVPGYVFEITVEPNEEIAENIIIGDCIGKGENLKIGLRVVNTTTNSIEIEVVRAEGASDFKYSIKKQGEEYGLAVDSNDTTYTFSGLTQGAIYTIKVEATKDGESQTVERTVQVGEIPRAIYGEVTWTGNGQAQVRIYTEENGYQLEWQKNNITEGSWTRESTGVKEVTIPNLSNGDNIYARLYDGVSSGDWANVQVLDNEAPEVVINFNNTTVETTDELTATVTQTDENSGVNIGQTKWVFNTDAGEIGTDAARYTGGTFTTTPETITLPTDTAGTYYLHVLTIDNAGNVKEVISSKVTINKKDVTVNWDKSKVDPVESADGITVPVPKGYTASSVATENTVTDGFVIYENTNGQEGKEEVNDSNVATAQTTRNQFVWVPVSNVHDMYGTDADGKKWGKLYSFSADGIGALNWTEQDGVMSITNATQNREPDAQTFEYRGDTDARIAGMGITGITTVAQFKAHLETEFNNMIDSVTTYGGFYIGRYETGNLSQVEAVVVKNNSDIGQTWYIKYSKLRGIAANSNVTTTMIWGCQWDATLRWMYNSGNEDKKKYTYEQNIEKGNFGSKLIPTGSNEAYAISNIYDMTGNKFDSTIESSSTSSRVNRGSSHISSVTQPGPNNRYGYYPTVSSYGTRAALYIN